MTALLVAGATAFALLLGLTAGWYLRPRAKWCPACGTTLTCTVCHGRTRIPNPPTSERPRC